MVQENAADMPYLLLGSRRGRTATAIGTRVPRYVAWAGLKTWLSRAHRRRGSRGPIASGGGVSETTCAPGVLFASEPDADLETKIRATVQDKQRCLQRGTQPACDSFRLEWSIPLQSRTVHALSRAKWEELDF